MKNFNYQKNKQAFGQAKSEGKQFGKDPEQRSAREERRRWNRQQNIGLTKAQRLEKEFHEYVYTAWLENRHIDAIKILELDPNFQSWADSRDNPEFKQIKDSKFEFFGFVEDKDSFSSYRSPIDKKVIVKRIDGGLPTQELPKVMFRPYLDKEDLALFIMKKEIGLCG